MEEIQRQRKEIEDKSEDLRRHADNVRREARVRLDPHLREITANLKRKHATIGLVCPVCGEGDHGNKMHGKPVCMMNAKHDGVGPVPLMTPEKAKTWKPPPKKFKAKRSWELDSNEVVRIK